ncbi:MAG TPA: hypothetical protein DCE41_06185 [Cytophagales bacterium]|nr:hypothetical protein [Cytophagales bacterium]HAA19963.1 hypothetical protein [Cytophagales bacterium]HAP63626.1 hypothetical protein [Cytophagales bacterium]
MTHLRNGLLVASMALLAACNNDLPDQPGALIVFETNPSYALGGDNNLQAYWVAALHPETHEVLDAQPIIPGENTTLIKPFLFAQDTYDLMLVRGFGVSDFNGSFDRVQVTMYEDFIPTTITLSGGGGGSSNGGDPSIGTFPRAESILNGVSSSEFGTFNYRLASDMNQVDGEFDGANVTFSAEDYGTRSGRYLLLREHRDGTPGWAYQQRLNQDGSAAMVFENDAWTETEVASYRYNGSADWISTSVAGTTSGGSSITLSSTNEQSPTSEYYYPLLPDAFPLQRLSFSAGWDNGDFNKDFYYSKEGTLPNEIPSFEADLPINSAYASDFSAGPVEGEIDYIRAYFSFINGDFESGYITYTLFMNPEEELWSPTEIDWPQDMVNTFPFLDDLAYWQQQFTSISLEEQSFYNGYPDVIDQIANQRSVSTDDSETFALTYSFNFQ